MAVSNPNIDKREPIIRTLPDKPGVYQYLDDKGKVIYIGKAKSLRKRVSSYFNKDAGIQGKTAVMVRKIFDIRHIVVNTELDALLLENNLIKKYQPRYNVNLGRQILPLDLYQKRTIPESFPNTERGTGRFGVLRPICFGKSDEHTAGAYPATLYREDVQTQPQQKKHRRGQI